MRGAAQELLEPVWGIREASLNDIRAAAERLTDVELAAARAYTPARSPAVREGSAVIRIGGPISRRPSFWSFLFGGISTEEIALQLREALADRSVTRVVLEVDSPGGTVDGVPELAAELYRARSRKPVVAVVDTTAASAAYWLASQASQILVMPSGSVGSIGVFGFHTDSSRLLDRAGITPTFVVSKGSPFKVEANPYEPLGDDARAEVQKRVDTFFDLFARDVARGRGLSVETVRADFGEGRMVLAKDAVKRGMADAIAVGGHGAAEDPAIGFAAARAQFAEMYPLAASTEAARRELALVAADEAIAAANADLRTGGVAYLEMAEREPPWELASVARATLWECAGVTSPPRLRFYRELTHDERAAGIAPSFMAPSRILGASVAALREIHVVVQDVGGTRRPRDVARTVAHECWHLEHPGARGDAAERRADEYAGEIVERLTRSGAIAA